MLFRIFKVKKKLYWHWICIFSPHKEWQNDVVVKNTKHQSHHKNMPTRTHTHQSMCISYPLEICVSISMRSEKDAMSLDLETHREKEWERAWKRLLDSFSRHQYHWIIVVYSNTNLCEHSNGWAVNVLVVIGAHAIECLS